MKLECHNKWMTSIFSFWLVCGIAIASGTVSAEVITAGSNHTCMIKTDKSVACWGNNEYKQATPPSGEFVDIDAGREHNCGIKTDGTIACWGRDAAAQSTPPPGNDFVNVSAGSGHTCAVKEDGTLLCWGGNTYEQAMPPEGKFVQASAGSIHTCAVKTDGTVACWGLYKAEPSENNFVYVGAGTYHSCGLKSDGSIGCWGNTTNGRTIPPFGSSVQISVGSEYACRINTSETLSCWGVQRNELSPQGNFIHVCAGSSGFGCGIKTNGKVVCWGKNEYGRATPPPELAGVEYLYGCTNPNATNYNPKATVDDGNCQFSSPEEEPVFSGCTNPNAINYHPKATVDDGNCQFSQPDEPDEPDAPVISGCIDPNAINYHPDATKDDGSCKYVASCQDHALYDLKKRTLTIPFIEIPVINFITGQSTGDVEVWTGTLKQKSDRNRFRVLSKTLAQITDDSTSECPAKYYLENGKLFIPYIDVPTGISMGGNTTEGEIEVYKMTLIWMQIGKSFMIQDIQKRP